MKPAVLLLALLALACIAHARAFPAHPDALSSVDEAHGVEPAHPRVEEEAVEAARDADSSEETLVRDRRSPRAWQLRPQPPPFPRPQPQQPGRGGSVSGGVQRERGVGTVVHGRGQGTVWTSRDGRSRVDAHGQWRQVVRGPARGKPHYDVGVRFEHRF